MLAVVSWLRPPLEAIALGSRSSSTPRTGPRTDPPRARRAVASARSRSRLALRSCIQDALSAAVAPITVLPNVSRTVAQAGMGQGFAESEPESSRAPAGEQVPLGDVVLLREPLRDERAVARRR